MAKKCVILRQITEEIYRGRPPSSLVGMEGIASPNFTTACHWQIVRSRDFPLFAGAKTAHWLNLALNVPLLNTYIHLGRYRLKKVS